MLGCLVLALKDFLDLLDDRRTINAIHFKQIFGLATFWNFIHSNAVDFDLFEFPKAAAYAIY